MKNNILVVDDDTRLRILLGKFLEENGFTVELASNAELAKEAIEKNNSIFQLIIIDIMMPGENGFELTSYFKQKSKTKTIPIIILTARGDVNDRLIGLEAGAEDYLSKPFEPKELLLRINNILKRANGARVNEDSNKNKEEICCFGEL
jgi:two-component system, OmpR family, phosphate regulon response regulator OmpR